MNSRVYLDNRFILMNEEEAVKLLAERFLKKEAISDWTIKCLEKGFDSKSLRMLAATNSFDSPFQFDDYFNRILKELVFTDFEMPSTNLKAEKPPCQSI
jgi:hypothetical protein